MFDDDNNDGLEKELVDAVASTIPVKLRPIPLWEERWHKDALKKKRSEDRKMFQRGFRLIAFSDDEQTFPSWEKCYSHGVDHIAIGRNLWPKVTGVDIAGQHRPGNAIVTVAIEPGTNRRYPVDIRCGKWKSNELAEQIAMVHNVFNPGVIMVEDNATQGAVIDWIKALKFPFWYKVEGTTTGSNKHHEYFGLPGLEVEFSNQAWVIPKNYLESLPMEDMEKNPWLRWDYEFRNHPLALSTDLVMATWFARQGAERYGGTRAPPPTDNFTAR